MGDTRRDSGEYYPGGRVVARTGTAARQAVVRWSDVEGRPDLSGYVDRIAKVEERISDAEAEIDADIKAVNVRISEHARDAERHITAAERSAWNGVAGKQDVIVQGGFLYVPDRDREGVWRRLQAFYDAEMGGVTTTCGDAAYVRGEDGGFVLDDSEEES